MTREQIISAFADLIDTARRRLEGCAVKECLVCADNKRVLDEADAALAALKAQP